MADPTLDIVKQFIQPQQQAAPAGTNPEDWTRAQNQMNLKYGGAGQGLYDQYESITQLLNRDVSTQQQYGQVADQKMAEIGNVIHGSLQESANRTGEIYQAGQQKVGGLYDELLGNIDKTGQEGTALLQGQAEKLGQQESLNKFSNPLGRIQASIAEMKTRAMVDKGNSVSNLVELGVTMQGIANAKTSDMDRLQAQNRTDLQKSVQAAITKLQLDYGQDSRKVLQQFATLAQTRSADLAESLYALKDARSAREAEAAKAALDAQIKMADLQIKMQEAVAKSNERAAANDPNSLDNQLKKLNITDKTMSINDKANQINYISDADGQKKMMDLINNLRVNEKIITGRQYSGIQNFMNEHAQSAKVSGVYNTADAGTILAGIARANIDPKTGMVKLPMNSASTGSQKEYMVPLDILEAAIQARYQNVGPYSKVGTKITGG
jgi:hypothetical protein